MVDSICIKANAGGKVQGVYFRKNTKRQADKLHLTGWAKNKKDGSVDIVACGLPANIALLVQWIEDGGSPAAEITSFNWDEIPLESFDEFEIR